MRPSEYPVVGVYSNDTDSVMSLHLEMVPEEVVLSPGHTVELLARPGPGLLPLDVSAVAGGLQIHACREWDPDWHVRFNGLVIKAGTPTILADLV